MLARTLITTVALLGALSQIGAAQDYGQTPAAGTPPPAANTPPPQSDTPSAQLQPTPDNPPAQTGPAPAQATQSDNNWRYAFKDGFWWYWSVQNRWLIYLDGQWVPYDPAIFANNYMADGSYGYDGGGYGYAYNPVYYGYGGSPGWFPLWYAFPFWWGAWWWDGHGWHDHDNFGHHRGDWDHNWNRTRSNFAQNFRGRLGGVNRALPGRGLNRGFINRGGINRGGIVNRGFRGTINRGNIGRGIGRGFRGGGGRMGLGRGGFRRR